MKIFPCSSKSPLLATPIVLLNGWCMSDNVWEPLLPTLQSLTDVYVLTVTQYQPLDALCETIISQLPKRSVLLGWSLGGMIATHIAAHFPQRVEALVTLASNAQFVADDGWDHGMAQGVFAAFYQSWKGHPQKTRQRFLALIAQGDEQAREQQRYLTALERDESSTSLASWRDNPSNALVGLALLREIKNQPVITHIQCPVLHCYGDSDALVPVSVVEHMRVQAPQHHYYVVPKTGHLLPYVADRIAPQISAFLQAPVQDQQHELKQAIATSFSRSATRYDQAAQVQQQAGQKLLQAMQSHITPSAPINAIADIGCGTGFFAQALVDHYHPQQYMGVDLAQGMLDVAASNNAHLPMATWHCNDAEKLPLSDHSVDIIYANFSLQWCEDLPALMAGFFRVLKPGGYCCFTSLGSQTLHELREAWAVLDQLNHVNQFFDKERWDCAIEQQHFLREHHQQYQAVSFFDTPTQLLRSLKEIGANVVKGERQTALMGKQKFARLVAALEQYRQAQGLPASYVIDEWILRKPQ